MIRTVGLTKDYGKTQALRGLDLHVLDSDVYGFIGPNGAGKSTTMRILATLLEPSNGEAWIGGKSVWEDRDEVRSLIGYLPDDFGVYRDMTVTEYLLFFAAAYGIRGKAQRTVVDGLLELTDLLDKRLELVDTLSRGMQQRLGLARALVHDPQVLLLDEPASGLDPRARIEVREILRELQRMGKTVLLSSHILLELQEVCSRVGILEAGHLIAEGTVDDVIRAATGGAVEVMLTTDDDRRAAQLLDRLPFVERVWHDADSERVHARLNRQVDLVEISGELSRHHMGIRHLEERVLSLEAAYMQLTAPIEQVEQP